MKVINLFGGPGSGKSTTAAGLFYEMKMQGYDVELVTEYAKDLVYSGQLSTMLEQQEYLFAEQNFRLQRLADHVSWAIIDSPILLSAVYPKINQQLNVAREWPALPQFIGLVKAQFESYDNINIYLERPKQYQTWGREHSRDESVMIDDAILQILAENYDFDMFETTPRLVNELLGYLEQNYGIG